MAVSIRGLGHVYLDIIRACNWYQEIGILTAGSRLEEIRKYVEERLLRTDTPEAKELDTPNPRAETYYALSDGAAFGLIATELSALPSNRLPRGTLRDILRGPFVPTRETPLSSEGRNKFVEIELAAHLSSVGFELAGFDDLSFDFEGVRYWVECKRPFRTRTMTRNIDEAYAQLRRKMRGSRDRGIVCVATDKMLAMDHEAYAFPTLPSVASLGVAVGQDLNEKVRRYEREWVDTRVIAFFGVVRFLARTEQPPTFGPAYNLLVLILAAPHLGQEADFERLTRMAQRIQGGFATAEPAA